MDGHDEPYGAGDESRPGDGRLGPLPPVDGAPGPTDRPRPVDGNDGRAGVSGPPRIRVTGEVPAVTGEVGSNGSSEHRPFDQKVPAETADFVPGVGSVVDRPAPNPPDWMSGVQVPELLVTPENDRQEVAGGSGPTAGQVAQRVAGLVLVALLVAVGVLVVVGSVTDLGAGLG